jgi:hypothetical protein
LWGFRRTFFKPDSIFWLAFMFQDRSNVSWRCRLFRATKPAKWIKCWKNSRTPPQNHRWTIHELADTTGISYEVSQVILTENLNMNCNCHEVCSPTLNIWSKAVAHKCALSYKRRLTRTPL